MRIAVISSVKGDYLVNLNGRSTAIELTKDGPAHVVIRPSGGDLAGVVTDTSGRETFYVLAPQGE
jgi:hypothetical protein